MKRVFVIGLLLSASLTFASQPQNTTSSVQQVVLTNHQTQSTVALNSNVTGDFAATDACGGVIPAA